MGEFRISIFLKSGGFSIHRAKLTGYTEWHVRGGATQPGCHISFEKWRFWVLNWERLFFAHRSIFGGLKVIVEVHRGIRFVCSFGLLCWVWLFRSPQMRMSSYRSR